MEAQGNKISNNAAANYISRAAEMFGIIENSFVSPEGILRGVRQGIILRKRQIGDVYYSFHGIGCYFKFKGGEIDVDFGPDGRRDGFDAYRLYDYLRAMPLPDKEKFTAITSEAQIENLLHLLCLEGLVIRPNLLPSTHLYYLKNRW